MGVKTSGFTETASAIRAFADRMADDSMGREVLREAVEPIAARMRENLESHRRTGKTIEDVQVVDVESEVGLPKVAVGTTKGKGGRDFVGNFLEFGTSKMPASPWARPALDAEAGGHTARVAAGLKKRLLK